MVSSVLPLDLVCKANISSTVSILKGLHCELNWPQFYCSKVVRLCWVPVLWETINLKWRIWSVKIAMDSHTACMCHRDEVINYVSYKSRVTVCSQVVSAPSQWLTMFSQVSCTVMCNKLAAVSTAWQRSIWCIPIILLVVAYTDFVYIFNIISTQQIEKLNP